MAQNRQSPQPCGHSVSAIRDVAGVPAAPAKLDFPQAHNISRLGPQPVLAPAFQPLLQFGLSVEELEKQSAAAVDCLLWAAVAWAHDAAVKRLRLTAYAGHRVRRGGRACGHLELTPIPCLRDRPTARLPSMLWRKA